MWQMLAVAIAAMVVVVIPFVIFAYEADDEGLGALKRHGRGNPIGRACDFKNCRVSVRSAFGYTLITLLISLAVLLISYVFLRYTDIPLQATTVGVAPNTWQPSTAAVQADHVCGSSAQCAWTDSTLSFEVTFVVYMAGLLTFVGWFIFSLFVGIGLVALPLDGFNAWRLRPHVLSTKEARVQRQGLLAQSEKLMAVSEELGKQIVTFHQGKSSRGERRTFKKFEDGELKKLAVLVEALETDVEEFQMCEPKNYKEHYNPIVPWLKLVGGVLALVASLLWIVHIIVTMLVDPPATQFLNTFFGWFDTWFPFLGTVCLAAFCVYLLLAVIHGEFKAGSRLFIVKIHPMVPGKTLLNSFLYNVQLILLTTLPVIHFSTIAFAEYTRLTDAGSLFGSQIEHMRWFSYMYEYNIFLYIVLAMLLLSVIYFSCRPSDRMHNKQILAQIQSDVQAKNARVKQNIESHGGATVELREW